MVMQALVTSTVVLIYLEGVKPSINLAVKCRLTKRTFVYHAIRTTTYPFLKIRSHSTSLPSSRRCAKAKCCSEIISRNILSASSNGNPHFSAALRMAWLFFLCSSLRPFFRDLLCTSAWPPVELSSSLTTGIESPRLVLLSHFFRSWSTFPCRGSVLSHT